MVNAKAAVVLIIASVLVAVVAGIAFAQYASAQADVNRGIVAQYPQGENSGYYQSPQQGHYPYGGAQSGGPNGHSYGIGMCMCGRFW